MSIYPNIYLKLATVNPIEIYSFKEQVKVIDHLQYISFYYLLSTQIMTTRNLPIVDWLQIEASSPAKFIISGEYSVVYEKQAVAAAIDLRTRVTIRPNQDGKVRLNLKNLKSNREWPLTSLTMCRLVSKYSECLEFNEAMPVKLNHLLHVRYHEISSVSSVDKIQEKKADDAAMAFLLLYIGLGDSYSSSARPPINVEVDSDIPVGSGLGSSSAYAVALCGALMRVFRVVAEKYIISNWAFNIDKFFHGRPSGVDNSTITSGGYILFQSGKVKTIGVEHKAPIKVMIIDTGVSRSTRALSETVKAQLVENPTKVNTIFSTINSITSQIWGKINDPNFSPKTISFFLQENQEHLNTLGVGHEKLMDICVSADNLNLVAKQTGAGGGGIAFVLYDESDSEQLTNISQFRLVLREKGYTFHEFKVGCEGLTVKITLDPAKQFTVGNK